ncbi:MAG: HAD-IB family hydrolase [Gammaproteobacteria bacterium]|nr:HAD-IB family hydrolase [Gammaproteobacteria bacterium]
MTLALFDLDNTLLDGDSDHAWGMYLAEIGAVDAEQHSHRQDQFYRQYQAGKLDIQAFLEFQLGVLAQYPLSQLQAWRSDFLKDKIQPMIETGKTDLLEQHRAKGHDIAIITATNDFITRPIADMLGVATLIATTAERVADGYSGKPQGTPCYQDGKVVRLREWLDDSGLGMTDSWFYSDSINDLPLLELCDNPVAVKPDAALRSIAQARRWPIIE